MRRMASRSRNASCTHTPSQNNHNATNETAASENQLGAFGIALVNDVAAALGVTGIPGPATDALWDGWFVSVKHTQIQLICQGPQLLIHHTVRLIQMHRAHIPIGS